MKTNGVVHFEIYARDAEKLAKFYSTLFDWTIEATPGMDYRYVKTVETDAQGMPTKPSIRKVIRLRCGNGIAMPGNGK
jgi:predicted enzyme related to lactoylglutathione lyase